MKVCENTSDSPVFVLLRVERPHLILPVSDFSCVFARKNDATLRQATAQRIEEAQENMTALWERPLTLALGNPTTSTSKTKVQRSAVLQQSSNAGGHANFAGGASIERPGQAHMAKVGALTTDRSQRASLGKVLLRLEGELERLEQEGPDYTMATAARVCRDFGFQAPGGWGEE